MRVAIIEKQLFIRRGLIAEISLNFEGVETRDAENFILFRDQYPDFAPDVAILSLDEMSLLQQIDLIRAVNKWHPETRIVVMGEILRRSIVMGYFKAGVQGFFSKYGTADELIECINLVVAGKRYLSPSILIWLLRSEPAPGGGLTHIVGNISMLTDRQREIAYYLARGMPTKWIAVTENVRSSTVSAIRSIIFKKLGVSDITQLRKISSHLQLDWSNAADDFR
jgi:DNA-binding NarL/FixJ family response regulator